MVRLQPEPMAELDEWITRQSEPGLSRPEAIRRLVELGLAKDHPGEKPPRKPGSRAKHAAKAAGMAGQEIDRRANLAVPAKELARRKRRLIKGPPEFRNVRGDLPKPKDR